jgi:hypothetical protein
LTKNHKDAEVLDTNEVLSASHVFSFPGSPRSRSAQVDDGFKSGVDASN